MQYALQCRRDHSQGKTHPSTARRAVAVLAASGAVSILDLSEAEWAGKLPRRGDHARALLISARRDVEDLREGGCRWDTEYPRDLWRLRDLGVPGQQAAIRFGQIPQPWLKALAKRWARWRAAAGGRSDAIYQGIRAITRFGQFLAASKIPVQGPGQVDRDLLERYLAVLQHELAGKADHPKFIGSLNAFFDAIRRHGWDDALPATAVIYPEDYPRARPQRLPRAVAEQVMAQVEDPANLALWDNPAYQLVTLILIRCGLRISDAIRLPFGCLVSDSNGAPYLRYLNHKMNREALVPLDDQLAQLIRDQQARVQGDYPAGQTVLFPQAQANRDGRKPMHGGAYRRALYSWLARCDIRDERGNPARITPHQWRHTLGTALINRDVPQHVVQKILDHYAGDLVKLIMLGDCLVEAGQQSVEDFLAPGLALGGGVVALLFEGGAELDGGLEERARFADGLEVAIQADGAGAVAVAEHALVHFGAEFAHLSALGAGGQVLRGVVEGLDLLRHCEVFLGYGAVGDAGIDHGHPHRSMPQKGGYRLEAHAPVDGLGGQRVAQAMGADVADPGGAGSFGDGPVDAALPDPLAVLDEQVGGAQAGGPCGEPGVEEVFELGVQRDIAVGAEFAERHVQPVGGADLHDRIDGEVQEFAFAQAGAGQELHGQADERVGVGAGGLQQLGERAVVQEPGQRLVAERQVAGEDQHGGGDVAAVPLGEPLEAGAQGAEVLGEADLGQFPAAGRWPARCSL